MTRCLSLNFFWLIVLMLVAYSSLSLAQTRQSIIVAGVELSLGAPREDVLKLFSSDEFKLRHLQDDVWDVFRKSAVSDELQLAGTIQFIRGKLYSVARDWAYSQHADVAAVMNSLFSAIHTVASSTGTKALVQLTEKDQPGISFKQILIFIQEREFAISILKDQEDPNEHIQIQERIQQ